MTLLVQFTTFSFANFFPIQYKSNVQKKAKGRKTEQSWRLWSTETNVQNSIKRWCYNYMYIDFNWFYARLWYCIYSVIWLWPLSSWKCFELPFPRKGCTSLDYRTFHTKINPSSLLESVQTHLDLSQTTFPRHFWPSCYNCRLRSADVLYLYIATIEMHKATRTRS